jgi:hypothetical protein
VENYINEAAAIEDIPFGLEHRKPLDLIMHGEPKVGRSVGGSFESIPAEDTATGPVFDDIVRQLVNGKAAVDELNVLKPAFGLALSKLPRKQLHIRLEDAATMGEKYGVQAKSDGKGGIILRSVNL